MAITHVLFVPECHADTALTLTLLRENAANQRRLHDFVSHQQGIGNVANTLCKQPVAAGNARRAVGIVDLDKKFAQQPYLREFVLLAGSLARGQHSHALLHHPTHASQYLIVLNPACDTWLWERASELGTTPADFGLPADFPSFKEFCKTSQAERDPRLRALLDAVATARHSAYRTLADFVGRAMDLTRPF